MGKRNRRRTRRRPCTLWAFKVLNLFGVVLAWACVLAVGGSIALELFSSFHHR